VPLRSDLRCLDFRIHRGESADQVRSLATDACLSAGIHRSSHDLVLRGVDRSPV
jgi:hypothetical protein